jgi:hypothetical protein
MDHAALVDSIVQVASERVALRWFMAKEQARALAAGALGAALGRVMASGAGAQPAAVDGPETLARLPRVQHPDLRAVWARVCSPHCDTVPMAVLVPALTVATGPFRAPPSERDWNAVLDPFGTGRVRRERHPHFHPHPPPHTPYPRRHAGACAHTHPHLKM